MEGETSMNVGNIVRYERYIPGHIDTEVFEVVKHAGDICIREIHKGYYLGEVKWSDIKKVNV